MKNKQAKRILTLLLAMALLCGFTVPVFAAGTARITFGQVVGKPGEQVIVPVAIENNPGIASFRFRIDYDTEALSFVSAQKADIMTGGTLSAAYQPKGDNLAVTWFDVKNLTGDGVMFYLLFEISREAVGEYPLVVSYLPEDIVNAAWKQVDCQVSHGSVQMGSKITGLITSFGPSNGEVTVRLMQADREVARTVTTDGMYQLEQIQAGEYRLVVSKKDHATREYDLTVSDRDVAQDVKIHLVGDIDGNGKVNVADISQLYAHTRGVNTITDAYTLTCGDVDKNKKVNVADISQLYAHIKNALW